MSVREYINPLFRPGTWRRPGRQAYLLTGLLVLCLSLQPFNTYLDRGVTGPLAWMLGALCSSFVILLLVLLCIKLPFAGYFILPFMALLSGCVFFMYEIFGERFTYNLVGNILDASTAELVAFLTLYNTAVAGVLILAGLSMVFLGKRLCKNGIGWRPLAVVALACLVLFHGAGLAGRFSVCYRYRPENFRIDKAALWPFSDIGYAYGRFRDFLKLDCELFGKIVRLPSLTEAPSSCSLQKDDRLTVVLHIGEGLRADHLPFNGYNRNTTPGLLCHKDGLVSFSYTQSYGPTTRVSLVGLLTDAEIRSRAPGHRPFIDLLKKHGFSTFSIIESGDEFNIFTESLHDYPVSVLLSDCHKKLRFSYSTGKNHRFEPSVSRAALILKSPANRKFIVLYDSGVHMFFNSLPQNKRWLPDNITAKGILEDIPRLNNAYDNCILEVDWEISSIIEQMGHRPAVYIYVADHGISLGEGRVFGNNNASREVFSPAFFVWMSQAFVDKYPEKAAAFRANEDKPVSHDYVMHTVLSIAGIDSPFIKQKKDLTRPAAEPFEPVENRKRLMELPKL